MSIDGSPHYTFISQGLAEDAFKVVEFKGTEGISRLYAFDITLASDDAEIDLKDVLQHTATLTIEERNQSLPIHGAVAEFEQLHEAEGHAFYRALLVPRLWQAGLYHENQLFLDKTIPEIIEEILKQTGLTSQDYDLRLTGSYPPWEYVCQYNETDFDFISRWMEREGIYYYFEQVEQNEKIIITDSSTAHGDIPGDTIIPYRTPSGLMPAEVAVKAFVCKQKMLPKKVILKDYNYRKPSLEIKGEAEVDHHGRGDVYIYGEHFKDPDQGNALARTRAEELKCREKVFHGEGTAPNLCPGFFFEIEECYREGYNRKYLILEVEHQGYQARAQWAGLKDDPAQGEERLTYANRFTAIASDIQFRPERKTPKPKFHGTINATVDATGDGRHAELDDQGRYKVILPFDQSGNKDGKASRYVRMAQPYAGAEYGMHFPLHKGAEVLLTFVDGDPDRPIISASAPNPEHTSPVTNANQTKSVVRDNFGNEIIFDATPGDEHIRLYSPHHNSGLEIGKSVKQWTTSNDEDWSVGNAIEGHAGTKTEFCAGWMFEGSLGFGIEGFVGFKHELLLGASHEWLFGYSWDYAFGPSVVGTRSDSLLTARHDIILGAGDEYCMAAGTQEPDAGNQNKSVMRATPDGVTLSVGDALTECGEGVGDGDWYEKSESRLKEFLDKEELIALAGLTSGFIASCTAAGTICAGINSNNNPLASQLTVGLGTATTILSVISLASSIVLGTEVLSDNKIEPVNHIDPGAKIWMHRDGTVGMISTKGEENDQPDGAKGKVVIGVNQQYNMSESDWEFYNSHNEGNWDFYDSYKTFENHPILGRQEKKNVKLLGEGSISL
jgi:type VI secretion system VgrG family protein